VILSSLIIIKMETLPLVKILKQVYTGAVRPIMEYASSSWATTAKTTKAKLEKIQNMGLRITLGAMKTCPIREMEKTADIEPLELRRQYKTLVQFEKSKRLPNHPLHSKFKERTKNSSEKAPTTLHENPSENTRKC
jgi:hypothetical protein